MQTETIPLDETECFSSFFIDYINKKPELGRFYSDFPTIDNFQKTIDNRSFDSASRKTLVEVLQEQYRGLNTSNLVQENIESLKGEKTFTVTTGHQLNIFTGPLYFIYKIVTVVNACKSLKKKYPSYNFVPVYWMASEDHDFEEINHFYYEGKKQQWETDQTGAVGRFNPSELSKIASQLPDSCQFFQDAYSQDTLADAGRYYVNHLFQNEGVVVVDADHPDLKRIFSKVIEDDLFQHTANSKVQEETDALGKLGYKTQVSPREINFFYLKDAVRERIEKEGNTYKVLETNITFSEDELKRELAEHPERFSPNVILRPLYQETILPNLAYVGGPSEAVYWLQLKTVFDHFKTPFPLLMPRNFALIVPEKEAAKWAKTDLSTQDLFLGQEAAFTKWVKVNSSKKLSYNGTLGKIGKLYEELGKTAAAVDPTLQQHLEALKTIASKKIEKAEKKLLRAEKRTHEEKRNQIEAVKEVLFPGGSLQERRDNFLNFYSKDSQFIQTLLDTFDAFEYRMYLLYP